MSDAPPPTLPGNQPLPKNPYSVDVQAICHRAYNGALELQSIDAPRGRVLGYLLLEATDDEARNYVATEIIRRYNDSDVLGLRALAQRFMEHLIGFFVHQYCDGPFPTWNYRRLDAYPTIDSSPRTSIASRKAALHRDHHRCAVSGTPDSQWRPDVYRSPWMYSMTLSTYIFPPFTSDDADRSHEDLAFRYNDITLDIIRSFAHIDIPTELGASNGHRLSNTFTLRYDVRDMFDRLTFWFEPVPTLDNTYYARTIKGGFQSLDLSQKRLVTFKTTDGLEPPDKRYLNLHAIVCRVAHLSGVIIPKRFTHVQYTDFVDSRYFSEPAPRDWLCRANGVFSIDI